MQTTSRQPSDREPSRFLTPALLSTLLSFGTSGSASGQSQDLSELPPFPPVTTAFEERQMPVAPWLPNSTPSTPAWLESDYAPSPMLRPGSGTASIGDNLMPSGGGRRRGSGATSLPLGPVDVQFDVSYGLTYGSRLLVGPGREEDSIRQTLTPGLNILAGDRWSLRYAPTASFNSAEGYKNSFDHLVSLAGSASAPGWKFGVNHATSVSSTPLVETARQTDQTLHSTGLSAHWNASPRDSLSFSLSQNLRFADGSPDSFSWANKNWYDRTLTDKLSAGIGVSEGYDLLDPGTDMFPISLNARIRGSLGDKLSYSLTGGAERREFIGSEAPANISPIASANVTYQIVEKASMFVGFDHSVDTSYFNDQFTENSSFQGGLTYNIAQKWTTSAMGGYRISRYQSTEALDGVAREDGSTFASFTVSWRVAKRLTTALIYSYRANSSDSSGYQFASHQVGLRVNYSL